MPIVARHVDADHILPRADPQAVATRTEGKNMSTATGSKAVADLVKKHTSGNFIKLANDGDSIIGAFVGDEYAFETVWVNNRTEFYDERKHKSLQPSLKITWNFYVPGTGKIMVLPVNPTTYSKIIACRDKYGLDGKLFEIKRQGKAGDTNTTYSVMPDADISKAQRKDIDALDRHDLAKLARGAGKGGDDGDAEPEGESGELISEARAQALIGKLKQLPREKLNDFLSKFGVERVRDLYESQTEAAEAYVAALSGESGDEERDPFA